MTDTVEENIKLPTLDGGKPEISMAPLIDVVFLLLIFFMVTTVFPENRGIVIEKPESKQAESLVIKKVTFVVTKEGAISFRNRTIELSDLERIVKEQLLVAPDTAVLLQIDKSATTEVLIKIMDACKAAGAKQVGIATNALKRTS
ncbi:MAG: biopolymer transporter ExbD [Gammaproteobacteria bacterium]|nr:biopolymer transporter ExbD [Gammaproteobacteria bacterium]MDH5729299.1 biopolymer transporter ExbD [Gammaproteobacteria bacterium]